MQRALDLAARGLYTTTPNPRVGCVIVCAGKIVGEGFHERAGEPHAEANALRAAGDQARGATAYVTLEPCAHHGRTPPCTEALVQAGVVRVVAAMHDPNPLVSGRGLKTISDAGIAVHSGVLEEEARELNIGFVSRMTRGRPWVRMKIAASLDGKTALANGRSQWITSADARRDGHAFRARACAVLTGIGTLRDDNPQLNVREVETPRQPLKILIDSRLEAPLDARLFQTGETLVVAAVNDPARIAAFEAIGMEVLVLPDASGKVELSDLMNELGRRQLNEVHVEAGFKLNGSLLARGLVDELLVYFAPSVIGASPNEMFNLPALDDLAAQRRLTFHDVARIGPDVRLIARVLD